MTHEELPAKLEVNYELNVDDVYAFSRYTYNTSRKMRVMRRGGYVLIAGLLLVGDVFQVWAMRNWPWQYLLPEVGKMVLELAGFVGFYYLLMRLVIKRTAAVFSKEWKGSGVMCKHKIVIDGDSLHESTEVGEQRVIWRGVERVEETGEHIFIYTAPATAHVIPKWAFATEGEAKEFFEAARTYHLHAA